MSAVEVTSIMSITVKTYRVAVNGTEPRALPFSRVGKHYRPCRIVVTKRDGNVTGVEMSGPLIKKDGSDGQQDCSERLLRREDWPEWLPSIVGGLA